MKVKEEGREDWDDDEVEVERHTALNLTIIMWKRGGIEEKEGMVAYFVSHVTRSVGHTHDLHCDLDYHANIGKVDDRDTRTSEDGGSWKGI